MANLKTYRRKFVFTAFVFAFVKSVLPGGEAGFGFTSFNQQPQTPKQHETELGATLQEAPPQVKNGIERRRESNGFASKTETTHSEKHSRLTASPSQRKGTKALKLMKEQLASEKASSSKLRAEVSSMQVKQAELSKQLQQSVEVEKELKAQLAAAEQRAEQAAAAMATQLQQSAAEVQAKAFQLELRSLTSEAQQRSQAQEELSSLRTRLDGASALLSEVREQREAASAEAQRLEADLEASQGEARTLAQCLKELAAALGVGGLGGFFMRWMTHRQIASEALQKIREMQQEVKKVIAAKRR